MTKLDRIFLISDAKKELEEKWDKILDNDLIDEITLGTCIMVLKEQLDGVWIPIDKRLPTKDEYNYNDGRIIVTDGNKVYQSIFDIYEKCFVDIIYKENCNFERIVDNKVIAWQVLPYKYKVKR